MNDNPHMIVVRHESIRCECGEEFANSPEAMAHLDATTSTARPEGLPHPRKATVRGKGARGQVGRSRPAESQAMRALEGIPAGAHWKDIQQARRDAAEAHRASLVATNIDYRELDSMRQLRGSLSR